MGKCLNRHFAREEMNSWKRWLLVREIKLELGCRPPVPSRVWCWGDRPAGVGRSLSRPDLLPCTGAVVSPGTLELENMLLILLLPFFF